MNWKIYPLQQGPENGSANGSGEWVVEATEVAGDQRIHTTVFSGAQAEARAQEYFRWISYRTSATAA